MDAVLENILASPKLPSYLEAIRATLEKEERLRIEFLNTITDSEKAEFINGKVVLHSPARLSHSRVVRLLLRLLDEHVSRKGLGEVLFEKSMISLTRNDYEPDLCYFRREVADTFTSDQMRFPAPDLVVEVLSPSTADRDRGVKFVDYAAHGIPEYWIVDADEQTVEQYSLSGEAYTLHRRLGVEDPLKSLVVEGFEVPVEALFDAAANQAALRKFLGSA